AFGVEYFLGVDGISLPLVLLTSFLSVLAMLASWTIQRHEKAYCVLFLLLETGLLGVFLALDFFLFYVFWEVTLLPMYFLIGLWGGPRREYAAVKFFLFTLAGSVLMLVAMLMLYFSSDLRLLSPSELAACHAGEASPSEDDSGVEPRKPGESSERFGDTSAGSSDRPRHTFNLLALAALGQSRNLKQMPASFALGKAESKEKSSGVEG
ncbi:MAG TPA: proton-conducting transporter membrane subunit, partial [Thermoguttaceae bacterium]|nr:proton-conducting transporter membrane subunit [Thermoguttaceae bacterium]